MTPASTEQPTTRHLVTSWMDRRKSVLVATWGLILAAAWLAGRLPLEWVPNLESPRLTVTSQWPGASPRLIERQITGPIERALAGVTGIIEIRSYSSQGRSQLALELDDEREQAFLIGEISARLAHLRHVLPTGVTPRVDKQIPEDLRDEVGFMTLQLVGPYEAAHLRRLADERLKPALLGIEGIAGVEVEGGEDLELMVAFDAASLAALDLELESILPRLSSAVRQQDWGCAPQANGHCLWLTSAPISDPEALATLAVGQIGDRTVRLRDVATVSVEAAPKRSISRIDGYPVVTLALERAPDSHLLHVATSVRAFLNERRAPLPSDVDLSVADDRSERVRDSLHQLAWCTGGGLVLIAAVLIWMLPTWRATWAVTLAVAVSLAIAVATMTAFGLSLNLLTLAGLAMVLGLLVDNAVVVAEGIDYEKGRGHPAVVAVQRAWHSAAVPLVGGTVTTLAVLAPLVYLSGDLRELFIPFGALTAITLTFSLIASLMLVPVFCHGRSQRRNVPPGPKLRAMEVATRWATRHPVLILVGMFLAIGLPTPLLTDVMEEPIGGWNAEEQDFAQRYNRTIGSDGFRNARRWLDPMLGGIFRPFLDNVQLGQTWQFAELPELRLRLTLKPGSGIDKTETLAAEYERAALAASIVEQVHVRVWNDRALIRVGFPAGAQERVEPLALRRELIGLALQHADAETTISGLVAQGFHSGLGDITGLVIESRGPSYEKLEAESQILAESLLRDPRVAEVDIAAGPFGRVGAREVLLLDWGPEAMLRSGLSARSLNDRLSAWLLQTTAEMEIELDEWGLLPMQLSMAEAGDLDLDHMLVNPFILGNAAARLEEIVNLETRPVPGTIRRLDHQYERFLRVYWRGPVHIGEEWIDETIAETDFPIGYAFGRSTSVFLDDEAQDDYVFLILAALGLVYFVLAAVLESWSLPWLVFATLPLAFLGVAAGFLYTEAAFAEGAFIGTVLLVGIAVNGAVLLVHRFTMLVRRRPATDPETLIRLAVRRRLPAMWTTTLTSVGGVLPLWIVGTGNDFWHGFAVTVTGGLLAVTALGPLVIAALISLGRRR